MHGGGETRQLRVQGAFPKRRREDEEELTGPPGCLVAHELKISAVPVRGGGGNDRLDGGPGGGDKCFGGSGKDSFAANCETTSQ